MTADNTKAMKHIHSIKLLDVNLLQNINGTDELRTATENILDTEREALAKEAGEYIVNTLREKDSNYTEMYKLCETIYEMDTKLFSKVFEDPIKKVPLKNLLAALSESQDYDMLIYSLRMIFEKLSSDSAIRTDVSELFQSKISELKKKRLTENQQKHLQELQNRIKPKKGFFGLN